MTVKIAQFPEDDGPKSAATSSAAKPMLFPEGVLKDVAPAAAAPPAPPGVVAKGCGLLLALVVSLAVLAVIAGALAGLAYLGFQWVTGG